jgi:hypothetical protein
MQFNQNWVFMVLNLKAKIEQKLIKGSKYFTYLIFAYWIQARIIASLCTMALAAAGWAWPFLPGAPTVSTFGCKRPLPWSPSRGDRTWWRQSFVDLAGYGDGAASIFLNSLALFWTMWMFYEYANIFLYPCELLFWTYEQFFSIMRTFFQLDEHFFELANIFYASWTYFVNSQPKFSNHVNNFWIWTNTFLSYRHFLNLTIVQIFFNWTNIISSFTIIYWLINKFINIFISCWTFHSSSKRQTEELSYCLIHYFFLLLMYSTFRFLNFFMTSHVHSP